MYRKLRNVLTCSLLVVGVVATAGCGASGGDDVPRVEVSGTVAIDDTLVASGSILFRPVGNGPSTGGSISNGEFRIDTARGPSPGTYRVTVTLDAAKRLDQGPGSTNPPVEHSQEVTISEAENQLKLEFSSAAK